MGCNYCCGDEAVFYKDNENCVFVGMNGEMLAIAKDKSIRFKVNYCPMCGRKFAKYFDLKKGDYVFYADIENKVIEHGIVNSVSTSDNNEVYINIIFESGDDCSFYEESFGVYIFTSENDAKNAIKQ